MLSATQWKFITKHKGIGYNGVN